MVNTPVSAPSGVIVATLGAGKVQFRLDLYDKAATISSSSNTIICKSGKTLPILLGLPSGFAYVILIMVSPVVLIAVPVTLRLPY